MKKKYLVSEDEFSGQVVIVCETKEVEVDVYKPSSDEINASIYLYRELPKELVKRTLYSVKVFYHYESGETKDNLLQSWETYDKNEANELFKQAIQFAK